MTLEQVISFEANGPHLFAADLKNGSKVHVCELGTESDATVAVLSLMAVVRAIPLTILPTGGIRKLAPVPVTYKNREWIPVHFPSDPDDTSETKLDAHVPEMEEDTQDTDCDACESEVTGA